MPFVLETTLYDNKGMVEKVLWFRGHSMEEATERRNSFLKLHKHYMVLKERWLF